MINIRIAEPLRKADKMNVWFLTVVFNGHVSLTSLIDDGKKASDDVIGEHWDIIKQAYNVIKEMTPVQFKMNTLESEDGSVAAYSFIGETIKAALLKA